MKTLCGLATIMMISVLSTQPAIAQHVLNAVSDAAGASANPKGTNSQIDYPGFLELTEKLTEYRAQRLISLDQFVEATKQQDAIILDTRSAAAFAQGHIEGAINIPFSDFTEEKLTRILGDKARPILIYCNNNFRDDIPPVVLKRAPLALNIPTFINLYGYGYQNIYELDGVTHIADPRVRWTAAASLSTLNSPMHGHASIADALRAN